MVRIAIKKGLDIPIEGAPSGGVQPLVMAGESASKIPERLALNLEPFDCKFHLLAKVGDRVKCGDPIAADKKCPSRYFVAPASGVIQELQRGDKRLLRNVVIARDPQEEWKSFGILDPEKATREELVHRLKEGGIFSKIRMRPFNLLADPDHLPRSIFVQALESAPFMPPAEMQVAGNEHAFEVGLKALTRLTEGPVHLVYRSETSCKAFTQAKGVLKHEASGPHPIANPSLHIQQLDPIRNVEDRVWTVNAHDVVCIGYLLSEGKVYLERIVGIGGPGVVTGKTGFYRIREGYPVSGLISGRIKGSSPRLVSGDPLNGHQVAATDYLRFNDFAFSVIPEMESRQFLHFFRLGAGKYSFSRAYLSGHLNNADRRYPFTTSLHGEHRPFIDATLYDKVQPLEISTMMLVKAVMAEDYDLAEKLGLLEVVPEDFSLTAFVCPSKIEMPTIIREGQALCIQSLMQ